MTQPGPTRQGHGLLKGREIGRVEWLGATEAVCAAGSETISYAIEQ